MFILLNIMPETNKKQGFWKKQSKPVISVKRVKSDFIAPFFVMDCEIYKGIVPFNTISAMSGSLKKKFVLPHGIILPPDADIAPYRGSKLKNIMLVNTAIRILEKVRADRRRLELTLIDAAGELSKFIEPFVMLSGKIKVITENREKYEPAVKKIMKDYGLQIILSSSSDCYEAYGVVISPEAKLVSPYFKGVLFTNSLQGPECSLVIRGAGADISEYYAQPLPAGVDSVEMAEALYSLCFASELEKAGFLNLYVDRIQRAYEETQKIVDGHLNRYAVSLRC